jgi:hypothetical protein
MYPLEELVQRAKVTNNAGIGVARNSDYAVIYVDAVKAAAAGQGGVGAKNTGLVLPENAFVESGLMRVETAVTGAFNLRLLAAGDIIPAQTAPAAGEIVNATRVANSLSEKPVLLDVTTALTAGKALFILRIFSY